MAKQIFVTGHKNPDTDSICSSIAYAKLKQLQGINAAPIRAGEPNKETAFALNYFNVTPQPLVKDFYVKVGEAVYSDVEGLAINASLKDAAKWFTDHESDVAPVVDNGQFVGVIEKAQLADQFIKTVMGEELSTVKASFTTRNWSSARTTAAMTFLKKAATPSSKTANTSAWSALLPSQALKNSRSSSSTITKRNRSSTALTKLHRRRHRPSPHRWHAGYRRPDSILFKTVGCTATIVTGLYEQAGIAIPKDVAGLLLSAVISDTVLFRSPTCTPTDREAAEKLANIAGVDIEKYGMEMLKAGANVSDLTPDQIVHNDMKEFTGGDATFTVAQVQVMDTTDLLNQKQVLLNALEKLRAENGYVASFLMITSIIDESTNLIFAGNMDEAVSSAFGKDVLDKEVYLPKVMSRKKQVIPPILSAMK